ncbi:MAG: DNA-binding protein, partial [Betaproteobacteria bacterium]
MDENRAIADKLREAAALLEAQAAGPFRAAAYRNAAGTIDALVVPVRSVFETEGIAGLDALPHIGRGIASAIAEILTTGRWSQLERLRGTSDPQALFQNVPGIGAALARRIHETLHVDTLEALEAAAHDGRLERVPGVGPRRAAACRAVLDSMLKRVRSSGHVLPPASPQRPSVAAVLAVDREYRHEADAGRLPTIAPRRFNP